MTKIKLMKVNAIRPTFRGLQLPKQGRRVKKWVLFCKADTHSRN